MLFEVPPYGMTEPDPRLVYLQTMLGAIEMLKAGVTAVHDDAFHNPYPTQDSISALMRAYADSGLRATVSINHQNLVEYVKYPFLAGHPARRDPRRDGSRAAHDDGRDGRPLSLVSRDLARRRERAAAHRGVELGAAARQRGLFRVPLGVQPGARPAVQHPHAGDQDAARAGSDALGQIADPPRARSRLPRRARDGDPRDLGRRRRHRPAGGCRMHRRAQSGVQSQARQRHHAVPQAARCRHSDRARLGRARRRRHHRHVGGRQAREPDPSRHRSGLPALARAERNSRRAPYAAARAACAGRISVSLEVGKQADLILVDLDHLGFTPLQRYPQAPGLLRATAAP